MDKDDVLNFLERDNFERELAGGPVSVEDEDAQSAHFQAVSQHKIIDVIGADAAGRIVIVFYAKNLPDNKHFDYELFLE